MKVKSMISTLLIVCMLCGCFVACGKNGNAKPNPIGTENVSVTEDDNALSGMGNTEDVSNSENIQSTQGTEAVSTENSAESEATENEQQPESTEADKPSKEEDKPSEEEDKPSKEEDKPSKEEDKPSKEENKKPAKAEKEYKPSKLEKNVFFDSLVYTGYNIEKHRADGMMWKYLLASKKRARGWLSDIGYAGGSSGYETTKDGKPDISFFEKNGLVCASYATYVYYNYLPNVAGIDVSKLAKPKRSYNADDWYKAAQKWVKEGYSEKVGFKASLTSSGFIKFSLDEEIPVGSIMVFTDAKNKSDTCSHIAIYAGYKNNYHWVYHVGNDNGPEFCAVERMHFGPDPQWPIAVITTPDFIVEAMQ